jgi:hypothetical protein
MKKTTLFLVFSFLSLFSIVSLAMVTYRPDLKKQLTETYSSFLDMASGTEAPDVSDALHMPEEIFIIPELERFRGRLGKDAYDDHLLTAESKGVGLIEDEKLLFDYVGNQTLVEANSGLGYRVDKLTHSHPYMTPEAKKVLEELGKTFQANEGGESYFTVSSVTRTMDQQKKLYRRNRNATSGNSSHSYGVSFDISYIRFNGKKAFNFKAQKQLEAVLNYFQETNKIYVIKERKQNCYHITVR